jgi:ferredoxin/flavodoxin---NADP+ reductase
MPTDPSFLDTPRHAVAVIGGACSGAEAAEVFASHGVLTVVFDMNARPFGKIEDGLPRWHARQRQQEYVRIAGKLKQPGVHFVPKTAVGRDVSIEELYAWGFNAVVLACGAWRDRPLNVPGADRADGHGLVYQNPFIYWFNHHEEQGYDGPRYEVRDGSLVVGGGLASIDVVKAVMLELVAAALRERGETPSVVDMEHKGLDKVLGERGLTLADLGLQGCTLLYRRTAREMPIAQFKPDADEASRQKTMDVREKLMTLTQQKYLVKFRPNTLPKELVFDERGELAGVRVVEARTEGRQVVELPGTEEVLATGQVFSSIGSIPEPIPGLPLRGEFYDYEDWDLGVLKDMPALFGVGNVVTGQGNIAVSRRHAKKVADAVVARYLGVGERELAEPEGVFAAAETAGEQAAESVRRFLKGEPKLDPERLRGVVERTGALQRQVGYTGDFDAWIAANTPPDRV